MMCDMPSWLNADFAEKVLRKSEKDASIEVKDVATKAATAVGDNYTSDMIRATVEYSRNKSGRRVTEKISLIVKVAPTVVGNRKDMIEKSGIFNTEMSMMEDTLEKMNVLLNEEGYRLGARVLYTEIGDPSFLVIQDLAPLGYRMADRQAGLDRSHCVLALRGLAKFHASSVALCEKEPQLTKKYYKGIFHNDQVEQIQQFFSGGMSNLAKEVAKWTELGPGYSEKISKLSEVGYKKATEAAKPKDGEFHVINHGDFWVNNMLFRYNVEGKPSDHIFVDFQLCVWTSPALDILYFLNTSPSDDVIVQHRDALLEEYLDTLKRTMTRLGCKTEAPSMAALEKSLKEREFYGVISACTILPLLLVDKSEAKSLDEILGEDGGYDNPGYRGQLYRKTMLRRLPDWNARGLLDV